MHQVNLPCHEASILNRLAGPDTPTLSAEAAEALLSLTFSPADQDRMHALAARRTQGALTADEQAEVVAYSRIGGLLGILKSKARRTLRRRAGNGDAKAR